jgi:hypothetical protein
MKGVATRAVLAVFPCLVALAPDAFAYDWTVKTSLSEQVEASDNYFLASKPKGESYVSFSTLLLDVLAQTPTSKFQLKADVNYRAYAGPGAENVLNAMGNGIVASFVKNDKLTDYTLMGSWRRQDLSSVQRDINGVSTGGGDVNTLVIGGSIKRQLSARDSIVVSANATSIEFSSPTSTPFVNVTSLGVWTHNINPRTDLISSIDFQWLSFDNSTQSEIMFWKAMMGLRSELSARLTFKGSAGLAFSDATQNAVGPPDPNMLQPGSSVGWVADMLLSYVLTKNINVTLFAAQTLGPNVLGEFQKRDILSLTLLYNINQKSSLSLLGSFTRTTSPSGTSSSGTASDWFNASVMYNYQLAREWQMRLSYRFSQRHSTDTARSNTVLVGVTRDYTILP